LQQGRIGAKFLAQINMRQKICAIVSWKSFSFSVAHYATPSQQSGFAPKTPQCFAEGKIALILIITLRG